MIPPYVGQDDWLSVTEVARLFKKNPMTIRRWYANGTLKEFGIETFKDPSGVLHIRLHIEKPQEEETKQSLNG